MGCHQQVHLLNNTNVVIQDWLELLASYLHVDWSGDGKQDNIQAELCFLVKTHSVNIVHAITVKTDWLF